MVIGSGDTAKDRYSQSHGPSNMKKEGGLERSSL